MVIKQEINLKPVITGIGIVAACGVGKENFWQAQEQGKDSISRISGFPTDKFSTNLAGELKDFDPKKYLGQRGLRNLDRSALFLLVAAKEALDETKIEPNDAITDTIGICTGTTFSHLWSIVEFDREVFKEGIDFANPALFPSTVINAASSQVSIRFNIQGFNTTLSTGYTSGLEALRYSIGALKSQKAGLILAASVDTLTFSLFFGFHKLAYMSGIKGVPLSCPFDKRRNGPVLGEAAGVLCVEDEHKAKARGTNIFARILAVNTYFDGYKIGRIHPDGLGLEKAIKIVLDDSRVSIKDIDYISSCANSSSDLDKIEVKVLKKIFGKSLDNIPVSSIKSMLGETFSAAGTLQISSVIGAMQHGIIPPTINYKEKDPDCDIDCVPNTAQKKEVKTALITSFGPGGYNGACIISRV